MSLGSVENHCASNRCAKDARSNHFAFKVAERVCVGDRKLSSIQNLKTTRQFRYSLSQTSAS